MLLRETNKSIDSHRIEQKNQQQLLDAAQAEYYHVVAEVSRLQQTIKHNETSHEETVVEINRLKQQADQANNEYELDLQQLEEIRENLLEAEEKQIIASEQVEESITQQSDSQQSRADWQAQWESYLKESSKYKEQAEVQRVKLSHLSSQSQQLQQRLDKLQTEHSELSNTDLLAEIESLDNTIELIETDREDLQIQLEAIYSLIIEQRQKVKEYHQQLHQDRSELQKVNGKITSLELLQQHAMGKDKKELQQWLEQTDLTNHQRLAEFIEVADGWEGAVEVVLGSYLEAICVENTDQLVQSLQFLTEQSVTLFETQSSVQRSDIEETALIKKIVSPWNLASLLSGIYCADDLETANQQRHQLKSYQSIITKAGDWIGPDWIKISRSSDSKSGVLQREKDLRDLKQRQVDLNEGVESNELLLEETELALKQAETNRESLQQKDKVLGSEYSAKSAQFSAYSAKQEQQQQRLNQVSIDIEAVIAENTDIAETVYEVEELRDISEERLEQLAETKDNLERQSQQLQTLQYDNDLRVNEAQKNVHTLQGKIDSLKASELLTTKQIERLQIQNEQASERIVELETKLNSTLMPLDDEKLQLESFIENKEDLEHKLQQERAAQQQTEAMITQLAEQHTHTQRAMEEQKELLDKVRFEQQDSNVRQQTITEQLEEIDADPEQILQQLSVDAEEQEWKRRLESFTKQIDRLGSINLTAIEEYKSQAERMNFLNEQHDDLIDALNTLEHAISKIDNESRRRFKETFDKINTGLQLKFPKLFGGGQAYLELTDADLLEAGVNIIARPPGKRNSSIHLLSGGEKALTAVALVFSIFDLNPAPFCLLDEVDAPLDDANVVRFSQMVEEMSSSVQFLYISHNKVTMEIAKQLAGVTMKEPGVSRMVSVDIEDAIEMAES